MAARGRIGAIAAMLALGVSSHNHGPVGIGLAPTGKLTLEVREAPRPPRERDPRRRHEKRKARAERRRRRGWG